jgi:ribosomal protein L34E
MVRKMIGAKWFKLRLKSGESIKCDECKTQTHGKSKEPFAYVWMQEAIRQDETIGNCLCENCFKEKYPDHS